MEVFEGRSLLLDAESAVAEATQSWGAPNLVLVFSSPTRPAGDVARAFARRFPAAQIVGCTSAGEHSSSGHSNGALVATGIHSEKLRWATGRLDDLATADSTRTRAVVDGLFAELGVDRESFEARRYFCLCFIDGLSGREEAVSAMLAEALDGITLVGGSAGDDMRFLKTEVIAGGEARSDAAVIALCECGMQFSVFKHQHFTPTESSLAITRADVAARRVYELDGIPAAQAYARALGVPREALNAHTVFAHPLAFTYKNQLYIRSVREVFDDDSIAFFCAIEEGMVVDVAACQPLVPMLAAGLSAARPHQPADLIIGANCILRALETGRMDAHAAVAAELGKHARHVIGFDTYGEQLDGLHINQTLVALMLTDLEEAA